MDALDYLKAKNKMAKGCSIPCYECPLLCTPVGGLNCCSEEVSPEQAVEIVEKWWVETQFRVPEDTPIDAKVLCSYSLYSAPDCWVPRHFAGFENGRMMAWQDGCTSHTTEEKTPWDSMKLVE